MVQIMELHELLYAGMMGTILWLVYDLHSLNKRHECLVFLDSTIQGLIMIIPGITNDNHHPLTGS